jgi:hypothetical protein
MKAALIVPVLAIALVGCNGGTSASSLAGTYAADPSSFKMPADSKSSGMEGMAKAMLESMKLELKADGTFNLNMIFEMSGKYTVNGNTIRLTPDKIMGQSIEELKKQPGAKVNQADLEMEILEGGKKLKPISKNATKDVGEFIFVKK